jgi:hypothetical protein
MSDEPEEFVDIKAIVQEMRDEGKYADPDSPGEYLREFGYRNAIADLRRQARALGETFTEHDVEQATMDQGTTVLRVVIGETNLFSAYRVDGDAGSISFTMPGGVAESFVAGFNANEERPRWLH